MNICIVDKSSSVVVGVGVKGEDLPPHCSQPTTPPEGFLWIESDVAGVGWTLVDGVLMAPPIVPPTVQQQIAAIDVQMNSAEASKLLGRTTREDMLARWVRDYVRVAHPEVNPFTVKSLTDPLAIEAFAAFADSNSVYYNPGVGRLKVFDDGFTTLRAQRTQLEKALPPK